MSHLSDQRLFLSIIVPTYNRPARLHNCLRSIAGIRYPSDLFEIIVVDDGSRFDIGAIIKEYSDRLDIKCIRQLNRGASAARNAGAAMAKGDFLVFTDDDCRVKPNWLSLFSKRICKSPEDIICGSTIDASPENLYSSASQIFWDFLYEYFNQDPLNPRCMNSANMALPKNTYLKLGGFNENFKRITDREFLEWCIYNGYQATYDAEITVYHHHPTTFASFWKQHFSWGKGTYVFHVSGAKRGKKVEKFESMAFYFHLIFYPLRKQFDIGALICSFILILTQAFTVIGFISEGLTHFVSPGTTDARNGNSKQ